MKQYIFLLLLVIVVSCSKKEDSAPLSTVEKGMIGLWKEFGDTTFVTELDGRIDTVVHVALIQINEDRTFSCQHDSMWWNGRESTVWGEWWSDSIIINKLFFRPDLGSVVISYPNNTFTWIPFPMQDSILKIWEEKKVLATPITTVARIRHFRKQ